METNYVIINSKYRTISSSSSSDFVFQVGETLEVTNISIKNVTIVNCEYNIKEGHNKLVVNDGSVDTTVTITAGQYDINSLITELQTAIGLAILSTVTIVLNDITKKLVINSTVPIRIVANDYSVSPVAFNLGLFTDGVKYYPDFVSNVINVSGLPNLQGANNYHVVSSILSCGKGSLLKNNEKRAICLTVPVPLQANFGDVINYEAPEKKLNERVFTRPINIQEIDIKIVDDDNEIVNLQNTNVEIILQINKSGLGEFNSFQGNHRY